MLFRDRRWRTDECRLDRILSEPPGSDDVIPLGDADKTPWSNAESPPNERDFLLTKPIY
jgi:hypothetical protein